MLKNISTNYILIHGAWHGSWCWNRIAPRIEKPGSKVLTPDLPGHYDNKYNFKNVTLITYVDYITKLVQGSDKPVVLIGHSMVISQVAENVPDKINNLIYISAFVPDRNGSLLDEEKQAKIPTVALEIKINEPEYSIILNNNPSRIKELFYNCCNDVDVKYALQYLQPQPLRPFADPVSLSDTRFGIVSKLYIECLQDQAIMIGDQRRMHNKIDCDIATIDTDHSPFFSAEDQLVDIICSASHN